MQSVTFDGKRLEGEDKVQVLHYFNQAKFLKKIIYFRNEKLFLHQENFWGLPLIMDRKRGKNNDRLLCVHVQRPCGCSQTVQGVKSSGYSLLSSRASKNVP